MPMRDDIKAAIEKGGATKESLLELTGTTDKGLASQFTYLRMMGTCPMRQDDGTYKIVSAEEWAEHRSSSGTPSVPLTPEKRVEKAEKRSKRAATAYDNAKKRKETNPEDRLTELKFIKAEAELEIAEIELGAAEAALRAQETDRPDDSEEMISAEDVADLEISEEEELA